VAGQGALRNVQSLRWKVIFLKPNRIYTHTMAKYSIVVPFNNEEETVTALYARLKQVMEQVGEPFELVLVDDGSSGGQPGAGGEAAAELRPDLGAGGGF
jgi:hypothetical protein